LTPRQLTSDGWIDRLNRVLNYPQIILQFSFHDFEN